MFNYYIPTRVIFGSGEIKKIDTASLPGKNALIVMSKGGSLRKNGFLDILTSQFETGGISYTLFEEIVPNPTLSSVTDGARKARENNCDFILGFGGGSSIDAAKAIAIMATNDGNYWDYIPSGSGKGMEIKNEPLPIMTISTTSGTGSEADPWCVVTNEKMNEKIGFGYEKTFPTLSIIDPELTLSVPPNLTAYQGFDALFHSIEGYINKIHYTISDIYCLESIRLVGKYLPDAVKDGTDLTAREKMSMANLLAGFVQSTSGCISEHAMEHAMSAYHPELPHGAGLILISVEYFTFLIKSGACHERFIKMAKALGKYNADKSMDFIEALKDLQKKCGVDSLKMSDFGITKDELPDLAANARATMGGMFDCDPSVISSKDCIEIFEKSYK